MKKCLMILVLMVCFGISANAQNPNTSTPKTTTSVPISNGCGSELSGVAATVATKAAQATDYVLHGSKASTTSCDQHDKDYYNGVPKKTADDNFEKRSPNMGAGIRVFGQEPSKSSYEEAQNDRKTSQALQSTWEKENQQSLDANNYRVKKSE